MPGDSVDFNLFFSFPAALRSLLLGKEAMCQHLERTVPSGHQTVCLLILRVMV